MKPATSITATLAPGLVGCAPSLPRREQGSDYRATVAEPADVPALLDEVAAAITTALAEVSDWGPSGVKAGQYRSDLAADQAALAVLEAAGVGVLSEESGIHRPGSALVVVMDPLDGSTNAAHGLPWYATALCALDTEGPVAALVVNLVSGCRYTATRGGGAQRDGLPIVPSSTVAMCDAFVALSGYPAEHLGWRQYRSLGAVALDLCAVADGTLDAFVDCSENAHGPWDYLASMLVCQEAGAAIADAHGRDLVAREHGARRTPVAAGTEALLEQLLTRRAGGS